MSIDEQAARWAVRLASAPLLPRQQRELEHWLQADVRHRGALVRARVHWLDLDRVAALHRSGQVASSGGRLSPWLTRRQWIGAAAAALAAGAGLSWIAARGRALHYVSGLGEVRRVPLADGSTVVLNTASEVLVDFSQPQRRIDLIRGEALFQVAPDRARPFVVATDAMAVRAVGTAFDVRFEANRMDVTVTEGTVELAQPTASRVTEGAQRVTVNERAVVDRRRFIEIRAIAPADAERQLAWRDGLLSFNKDTLAAAVAEINRYNRRQVVIDDPTLAAMPIVGMFRTTDVEDFVRAAAEALTAEVVVDGTLLRLRPRERGVGEGAGAPRG